MCTFATQPGLPEQLLLLFAGQRLWLGPSEPAHRALLPPSVACLGLGCDTAAPSGPAAPPTHPPAAPAAYASAIVLHGHDE